METRTGKGVVIEEVSKHQETPLTGGSGGSFQISEGNLTGRKKIKPTDYMPKSNSQQKSTPDARIRHQQVETELRGAGSIA